MIWATSVLDDTMKRFYILQEFKSIYGNLLKLHLVEIKTVYSYCYP